MKIIEITRNLFNEETFYIEKKKKIKNSLKYQVNSQLKQKTYSAIIIIQRVIAIFRFTAVVIQI